MAVSTTIQLSRRRSVLLTYAGSGVVNRSFTPLNVEYGGGRTRPVVESDLDDDEWMRLNMATAALLYENNAVTAAQAASAGQFQTRRPAL